MAVPDSHRPLLRRRSLSGPGLAPIARTALCNRRPPMDPTGGKAGNRREEPVELRGG
jgi:hypothetical protein